MGRIGAITLIAAAAGATVFIWPTHLDILGVQASCGVGPVAITRSADSDALSNALIDECRGKAAERGGIGAGILLFGGLLGRAIGPSEAERRRTAADHPGRQAGPGDPYLRCYTCDPNGQIAWPCPTYLKAAGPPP